MPDSNMVVDTEILKRFRPWSGVVPAGFFAYFLGNLTRADYWAFSPEIRAIYDRERHEAFSTPSVDDNIFDWLVLLEAVAEARDTFMMAALGAGWGRWLVAGAFAARQRGLPSRLIGVEAEPTHFQWMRQHFADNGLNPADHQLIEAAASGRSGRAWFYFGKPDSWYGQSIIHDPVLDQSSADETEHEYNGEKARLVRTIDLTELLAPYSRIDYLHMDIQGAELDVLSSAPAILSAKVKRILVGTHSAEVEEGIRQLLSAAGWRAQYDFPLNTELRVNDTVVTLGDGVQAWINPSL